MSRGSRYMTWEDVPEKAPRGYELTGEFRVPNDGEAYVANTAPPLALDTWPPTTARHILRPKVAQLVTVNTRRTFTLYGVKLSEEQARQLHRELDEALDG